LRGRKEELRRIYVGIQMHGHGDKEGREKGGIEEEKGGIEEEKWGIPGGERMNWGGKVGGEFREP
jgi:hypothetical protein